MEGQAPVTKYPVAQDNDYATWNAYHNQYWPAQYIIDRNGTTFSSMLAKANTMRLNERSKLLNDKS